MGRAFATADVVVARAGASTCFELAVTGKPSFLIPLPSALRNHQHHNAAAFVANQAAAEGRQDVLSPKSLANWLLHKAENRYSLAEMSRRMCAMGRPDAAARVADIVESVAKGK
jgi:UDP-N-acetylglucosamine--N-acetylmuramyl-(pentapeptide) pyrophosphoryl-undecaprenol N-acetylglucosamine transferase